ncbi:hypothetical protein Hte_010783 [Hypoxylon texense]
MSGFEIVGVILGGIPLVISLLEHYKACKGIAYSFQHYHGQVDKLINDLKDHIVHYRIDIRTVIHHTGIAKHALDLSDEECTRIFQSQMAKDTIKKYFGYVSDPFSRILTQYETCLKTFLLKLQAIHRFPNVEETDLAAIVAANQREAGAFAWKKRIRFVLRRSFLEDRINELGKIRTSAAEMISKVKAIHVEMPTEPVEPSTDALRLVAMFKRVQANAKPLFEVCTCQCEKRHKVLMKLNNRVRPQEEILGLGNSTTFNLVFDLEMDLLEALVRASQTEQATDDSTQVLNKDTAKQISVGVPSIKVPSTDSKVKPAKVIRICDHATEARGSSNILQLQLIKNHLSPFEGPGMTRRQFPHPVTLESYFRKELQNEPRSGRRKLEVQMTRKQRNLLALDIAAGIPQLRETHWFSSPFDSKRIKFFRDNWTNVRTEVLEPFIEQVMKESPLKWSDATEGPDPKTALLELAILLLEIWNDETLEEWVKSKEGNNGLASITTKEGRIKEMIEWLRKTEDDLLGEHVTAIDFCIFISSGRYNSWDKTKLLKDYCQNVIIPLYELCKAYL